MSLHAGSRLGPYEIVGLIGAGGMGEVYRARDPRLDRPVAIKVLPPHHAGTPDRIERFAREARAAAALNHPNILAVHDVGTDVEGPYLVSELLEGETLREASVQGRPWPARKVLDVAVQVAQGMAAAHTRGIVHRDLKPENIFLCADGVVKILDFGLARLTERAGDSDRTIEAITGEHTVLGTVGYMAPEQVRGQVADHRADIFAFGAVVYELLAGQRAFTGDTSADVMTAILTRDPPDIAQLQTVPAHLAQIVTRCLDKRPESRFQSASDLAFALKAVSTAGGTSDPARVARSGSTRPGIARRFRLATVTGPALAAGILGALAGWLVAPDAGLPSVTTAHRLTEFVGLEEAPAMSPDGKSVAFTAGAGEARQVFVRLIAGGNPLQITNIPGGCRFPRWSPDSSAILCFTPPASADRQGTLSDVPALGGAPRRIAASLGEADARLADGRIVYFRLSGDRIELVTSAPDGSAPEPVARFASGSYYRHPRWSPDGRSVAFQRGDGVRFDVFVIPAGGGEPKQLTHDNTLITGLSWLPDGSGIVYSSSRASTMPYLPTFHLWSMRPGDAAPRQLTSSEISYVDPDVHPGGTIVTGRVQMSVDIWKFPIDGLPIENVSRRVRITHQTGHVQTPTVGSDGRSVAFLSDSGGHANLWVTGGETAELRQITYERDPGVAVGVPIWSRDGRSIAFVSSRGNAGLGFGIWAVDPDGSHLRQLVPQGFGAAWSADGRWLYYVERASGALKRVPAGGGSPVTVRTDGARNAIGSDGSTLFYLNERPLVDGTPEYVIMAASPENGPSRVIAQVPASRVASWQIVNPSLSPDGKWLAQALTDGFTTNVWVVSTSTGEWRQVTDFGDRATFIARRVDWSPDGRFILAAVGEGDADIVLLDGVLEGKR